VPFNFRLNLQSVFRRLGIQSGARLPQLNENVQMTMLLTDLSRLIPAPIEPRGLSGMNILPPIGQFAVAQLQALSAGGIFIEVMMLRGQLPTAASNLFIEVNTTDLGLAPGVTVDVGGTPTLSAFTAGTTAAPTSGTIIPAPNLNTNLNLQVGIFVPNQSFFSMRPTAINQRLDAAFIYRELPSVEEVG